VGTPTVLIHKYSREIIVTILIRKLDGQWHEPEDGGYTRESDLQEILLHHPALVPGVFGTAIACKEFQSGVGPADVVVLDSEGSITIVECKLAANPQVRREVIGQVLDYASRMWLNSAEFFEQAWVKASADHRSPFMALDDSEGRIRTAVTANLLAGQFNLVLAVDRLNDDLKRIVEYLNTVTRPTIGVIVVEYTRAIDSGIEILIPRTYGAELVEAKSQSSSSERPIWTIQQYLDWCDINDPLGAPKIAALVTAARVCGFDVKGGKAVTPSLNLALEIPGIGRKYPICLYTEPGGRGALIEVRFTDFKNTPDVAKHLVDAVAAIPNQPIPLEEIRSTGYGKRPNVPAKEFSLEVIPQLATAVATLTRVLPINAITGAAE
jgi:hypothetical protein